MAQKTERKKSEVISILNNIDTFQQTFSKLQQLAKSKSPLNVDSFRIQLSSYAQQYVSGLDRSQFFQAFKKHSLLSVILELIIKNKDPHLFVVIMKSLSIISFNLKQKREVEFFLANESLSDLLEYKVDRGSVTETVEVYIQFLKSLALKFGQHKCVGLFYNSPLFPFMWRVFSFYNQNQQLSRTTIKSIIVEIVKINDFSVKAYLNNFPNVLFLGLLARYMMDCLSRCRSKKNTYLLDAVSDQMSFIDDLIVKVEESTKAFVLNSLMYYPIKHLWNSFQNKESKPKNILLLIIILFFNINDPLLMQLIFITFFQKRIPKQLYDFLKTNSKQLSLYSFQSYKSEFQGARKVIQTHCQKTFNSFNTEIKQVGLEVIHFKSIDKEETIINKSVNASKQMFSNFMKSYSWQGYVINEMKVVSEVIGATVKLNTPVSHQYTNNIYKTFESLKSFEGNYQNVFYSSLMKSLNQQPDSVNIYLVLIIHLLSNPDLKLIHSLISRIFIKQSVDILKALSKSKTMESINNALECFFISLSKLKQQQIKLVIDEIRVALNNLSKQSSNTLLQSQFSDWEDYFDVFVLQQQKIQRLRQTDRKILDVDYDIIDQQYPEQQKHVIYYYYMIRNIILTLKQQRIIGCQQILKQKQNQIDFSTLENISFVVNGKKAHNIVKGRILKIIQHQNQTVIYQGNIKKLNMKDILNHKIEINLHTHKIEIEFDNVEDKVKWAEEVCSTSKKIEEIEVLTIAEIVEKVPQL